MNCESQTQSATDFNDKRILGTGGTRGIGEAIVNRFRRGGGKVFTTGRSLSPDGSTDQFVQVDISTREGINQLVTVIVDRFRGRGCL